MKTILKHSDTTPGVTIGEPPFSLNAAMPKRYRASELDVSGRIVVGEIVLFESYDDWHNNQSARTE